MRKQHQAQSTDQHWKLNDGLVKIFSGVGDRAGMTLADLSMNATGGWVGLIV